MTSDFLILFFSLSLAVFQGLQDEQPPAENEEIPAALVAVLDPKSDIPPPLLVLDYKACFEGCQAGGFGAQLCTALCTCSIEQIQKRFVMKSYVIMKAQSVQNAFDEGNKIIMASIGETCAAQVTEKGMLIEPQTKPDSEKESDGDKGTGS